MQGRHGKGHGHGRRRKVFFIESCLLVLLQREPSYGYSLKESLREFGVDPDTLDPSILYRTLKDMEEQGLVSSNWDEENSLGPQRKTYTLTQTGHQVLDQWIQALRIRRAEIEKLEQAYLVNIEREQEKE